MENGYLGTNWESLCQGLCRGSHDDLGSLGKSKEHRSQLWPWASRRLASPFLGPYFLICGGSLTVINSKVWTADNPGGRKKVGKGKEESRKGEEQGKELIKHLHIPTKFYGGRGERDFSLNLGHVNLIYYMLRNEKSYFSLSNLKAFWRNKCIFLEFANEVFYWYLSPLPFRISETRDLMHSHSVCWSDLW